MFTQKYNPTNISPYLGKQFSTVNGTVYEIDKNGIFTGRKSLDGARVIGIAALSQKEKYAIAPLLNLKDINPFLDALKEYGSKPARGLPLAIVINQDDANKRIRIGLLTSSIESIV